MNSISLSDVLAVIASTVGTLLGLGYFFQVKKIISHRRADEISRITFSFILLNCIAWAAYGISIVNWAIIIANVVATVGVISVLGVTYYYTRMDKK